MTPAPSPDRDHRTFSGVIGFTGKDIAFSRAAVAAVVDRGVEIRALCGLNAEALAEVFGVAVAIEVTRPWRDPAFADLITTPETLGVNCGFDYIIPAEVLAALPVLNLHPAALPFNRGCHHSFWGIREGTPLGATLHWMDAGLDTGDIIDQVRFEDDGVMSAEDIQRRSNALCLQLLSDRIEDIMAGQATATPQGPGTYHARGDIIAASTLTPAREISADELFDLCRATHNKGNGFIVETARGRFRIRIAGIDRLPD